MDQESEGSNLVIFVVGGVVLLLLLLGGGAFFFFASWQEEAIRKEVEATSPLKEIGRGMKEFKPEPVFPAEAEKTPIPMKPDGEANTLQFQVEPKAKKQETPNGPGQPPAPPK